MKRSALMALTAACLPLAAAAHNYTYLEGGFLHRDFGDEDDSGFRIAGSADVAPPFALFGEYGDTGPLEQFSAGGLFHMPINNALDFTAGASVEHADAGPVDDTGYGLRAGLRWQFAGTRLEVDPELRYVDVFGDDGTSLRVAGLFAVAQNVDLQGAVQGGDDDRFELGLRYNFGPRLTGR